LKIFFESKKTTNSAVNQYIKKWQTEENKVNEFFIKNLVNVQGDERDIIIVSTLFGPDKVSGKVRQSFGPIVQTGGQRRLNVLFTRAKNQLILITSLKSSDIKIEDNSKEGKIIFKDYLAYAESEN
jgi:superfamily I DNA and/or RNA helicase